MDDSLFCRDRYHISVSTDMSTPDHTYIVVSCSNRVFNYSRYQRHLPQNPGVNSWYEIYLSNILALLLSCLNMHSTDPVLPVT